ncbi:MAG TPA: hypothetical protein VFG11_03125, partial [Acidobacteriota bacterium]|nr:hypothetical protein [Acidobacteriota bacterium]
IVATWDNTTCSSANAVIEYGTIGNYVGYTAAADCSGGTSGTKTFAPPAGSVWFNIVWQSGTTCGHPGYASSGARNWSAVGTCSTAADDSSDGVCN